MYLYTYTKDVNSDRLTSEVQVSLSNLSYINTLGTTVELHFSTELDSSQINTLTNIINSHVKVTTKDVVVSIITNAIIFGAALMTEFAAENVAMGITQEGMTGTVRKNMTEIINALQTGSLYDVIDEVRAIPAEKKDPKYITDARLLLFVNKIEDYLGKPRSSSL